MGKGGTGKTTVCAALARAAADRGLRVGVAEVSPHAQIPRLLDPCAPEVNDEPCTIAPGIDCLRIDPYAALGEYLSLELGAAGLIRRVVKSQALRQLTDASPGWRELITLGKIWHLEQMRDGDRARYDLLIVDAPATGHGIPFLDVPRVVVSAVRSGPLRERAALVQALLADPERTLLLPVTRAEELPARETAELVTRVRDRLGIAVDRVIVNALQPTPFPEGLGDLDQRLAALPPHTMFGALGPAAVLAECAAHLASRHAIHMHHLDWIETQTKLPSVKLPYVADGFGEPAQLDPLAAAITREPETK